MIDSPGSPTRSRRPRAHRGCTGPAGPDRPCPKRNHLRNHPRATVVLYVGRGGAAVEGPVELAGPGDPLNGGGAERLRLLLLLREIYTAAGGTHDDYAAYDKAMAAERRMAVLVTSAGSTTRDRRYPESTPGTGSIARASMHDPGFHWRVAGLVRGRCGLPGLSGRSWWPHGLVRTRWGYAEHGRWPDGRYKCVLRLADIGDRGDFARPPADGADSVVHRLPWPCAYTRLAGGTVAQACDQGRQRAIPWRAILRA